MALEKTTQDALSDYQHLFDIGDRVKSNASKEIETIILEVCNADRKLQFEMKVYLIKARELSEDGQAFSTDAKVSTLCRKKGLILESVGVMFEMGSAIFGGTATPIGMGLQGASGALNRTSQYNEKCNQADLAQIEHDYQRLGFLINQRAQGAQGADRQYDQDSATIDRLLQTIQRQFELMLSHNG